MFYLFASTQNNEIMTPGVAGQFCQMESALRLVIVTTLWLLRLTLTFVNFPCLKVEVHKIESVMRQQNPEEALIH